MNETGTFLEMLRREGVVRGSHTRLTPLSGGVSCEIYLVEDGMERFVVKRALAKLKVKADWFADVNRNRHEREFIRYVARFLPEAVPALRYCSATNNYFAMEHLNGSFLNWKQVLLSGQTNVEYARRAADMLAQIHHRSAGDTEAMRLFDTTQNFFQLRIEPFLLATAAKHPTLRLLFEAEATRLAATHECLVHGDFSPKNILVSSERMVILDCEVAWYGDPAFDLAFLLNHFFLKALLHLPCNVGMKSMVSEFWEAYQRARPTLELEPRVCRLLPMLMLARVDGKSPVEYLDTARQQFIREFVHAELSRGNHSFCKLTNVWFNYLDLCDNAN